MFLIVSNWLKVFDVFVTFTVGQICISTWHGVSTPRGEKGGGRRIFYQFEPNFPLPYCPVVEGCQAGGLGHLLQYMRKYNAESPKQGSKRFNYIYCEDDYHYQSGYNLSMFLAYRPMICQHLPVQHACSLFLLYQILPKIFL